jgi:hypothetical protein
MKNQLMEMVYWIYKMMDLMVRDFDLKLTKTKRIDSCISFKEDLQRLKSKVKHILIKHETNFDLDYILSRRKIFINLIHYLFTLSVLIS